MTINTIVAPKILASSYSLNELSPKKRVSMNATCFVIRAAATKWINGIQKIMLDFATLSRV